MRRFFIENLSGLIKEEGASCVLPKDIAHRIDTVLRTKHGDVFELIDGNGLIVEAVYQKSGNKPGITAKTVRHEKNSAARRICLAVSIIRRERFELAVEKAVELGADCIYPVYTGFCKPYGRESAEKLRDRWQKIADQALSQCKRTFRCVIHTPGDISGLCKIKQDFEVIALHPGAPGTSGTALDLLPAKSKDLLVIIGPEGGFSDEDLQVIKELNARSVSLNTGILRTETAAFYVLSVLNYASSRVNDK